jgi:hypothetical protein
MKQLFLLLITVMTVVSVSCKKDVDPVITYDKQITYYVRTDNDSLKVTYRVDNVDVSFILKTKEWTKTVGANIGDQMRLGIYSMKPYYSELKIMQDSVKRSSFPWQADGADSGSIIFHIVDDK